MKSISCLRGHRGVDRKAEEHVNVSAVLPANRHWHSHSLSTPLPVTPHLAVDWHLIELRICLEPPAADRQLTGLSAKSLEWDTFSQRLSERFCQNNRVFISLLPKEKRDDCFCLFSDWWAKCGVAASGKWVILSHGVRKKVEVAVAEMFTQGYLWLCKFDYKLKIHKQMSCLISWSDVGWLLLPLSWAQGLRLHCLQFLC